MTIFHAKRAGWLSAALCALSSAQAQEANPTATALGDLGWRLLQAPGQAASAVQENTVVSPLSLAYALGLVHAGSTGATANELARVLGSTRQGRRLYAQHLPELRGQLTAPVSAASAASAASQAAGPLSMANRLWLDEALLPALQAPYAQRIEQRYGAQVGPLTFGHADLAREAINRWVSEQTAKQIPELMPAGSVNSSTRLVLTNAVHFKSAWQQPFPALQTQMRAFTLADGQVVQARTMQDERELSVATVAGTTVLELPFANTSAGTDAEPAASAPAFSLLLAMPGPEQSFGSFSQRLRGADLQRWRSQLKPQRCTLSLPRFEFVPTPRSLKASLQALGVKRAFDERADFSPMLGRLAKSLRLENVYQSVAIRIDESGGEASAATAAVVGVKSMQTPAPACAVLNRPFVFALIHTASGTPLFLGQMLNPLRN